MGNGVRAYLPLSFLEISNLLPTQKGAIPNPVRDYKSCTGKRIFLH